MGWSGAPPHRTPSQGRLRLNPSALLGWMPAKPPAPLLVLCCGEVHPHPGPLRVAQANVRALCLHWHTVAESRVDVVLLSETRLKAVAQLVMRAQTGAPGWQAFWVAPLDFRGGGGGHVGCAGRGGRAPCAPRRSGETSPPPPKGAPRNEADSLAQTLWHSTCCCHVLVGLGRGAAFVHTRAAYRVSSQPALNWAFRDRATHYVARPRAALQLGGGDLNLDLDHLVRAPLVCPSVPPGPQGVGRGP